MKIHATVGTLGLTIALVHLMFNLTATVVIYPWDPFRRIPLNFASRLADVAADSKWTAILYVVGLFYAIPVLFAVLHEMLG